MTLAVTSVTFAGRGILVAGRGFVVDRVSSASPVADLFWLALLTRDGLDLSKDSLLSKILFLTLKRQ